MVNWPAIVEECGPYVWRTAYRLLSDREAANDCYQETFLSAVKYSTRQEVSNWSALLKRIATARALDQLRRRYRNRTIQLESNVDVLGGEPAPDSAAEQREWMGQLRQALTELSERQAEVFWLSEVENMKHSEIADQLDATTTQVANWLFRAKERLRELLVKRGLADEVKR